MKINGLKHSKKSCWLQKTALWASKSTLNIHRRPDKATKTIQSTLERPKITSGSIWRVNYVLEDRRQRLRFLDNIKSKFKKKIPESGTVYIANNENQLANTNNGKCHCKLCIEMSWYNAISNN